MLRQSFPVLLVAIFVLSIGIETVPTHNPTTLRLLQIIHTHGDRTPSHFVSNDPYADVRIFWPEGIGQLNKVGRNRMYRVGRFLAATYDEFIHSRDIELEKFIYAQSSASRRCLESMSFLLSGFFGGEDGANKTASTNYELVSQFWRPIPIKSSFPKGYDRLLDDTFPCPNAELEWKETEYFDKRIQRLYEENGAFLEEISNYTSENIHSLKSINELYQELFIESQYDMHWWKKPFWIWSDDYEAFAISKLREIVKIFWSIKWNNRVIQRLLVGKLVHTISDNMRAYINGTDRSRQVYVYSTHDSKIAMILHALNIFNGNLIPPGASIMLELHEQLDAQVAATDPSRFYLRLFYLNETYSNDWAYELTAQLMCPTTEHQANPPNTCAVKNFLDRMSIIEPDDLEYECGNTVPNTQHLWVQCLLGITNIILILIAGFLFLWGKCSYCTLFG